MGDTSGTGSATGINWGQLLGGLASGAGLGLAASDQQNGYNVLQNALQTIGPTALQGYGLTGPGGSNSSYNTTGGANIDLGSLNGAFGNLASAGTSSAGNYSPQILQQLLSGSNGTLNSAQGNLNSAYGSNSNYQGLASGLAGSAGQTYNDVYNNTLSSLQAQQQPGVQQQAFGLQNTLFGRGVLDTTGAGSGAIAAGNFGSQVNAMNAQDSLSAQTQALQAQTSQTNNAATLSGTGNSILSNAFSNFGNTNSLISGLNTAQLNNSATALNSATGLNTMGLNNLQSALGVGSGQATARNQSLFPYASTASALAGTQTAQGLLGNSLSSAGSSLLGSGGLSGLLTSLLGGSSGGSSGSTGSGGLAGLLSGLFGGGTSSGATTGSDLTNLQNNYLNMGNSGDASNVFGGNTGNTSLQNNYLNMGNSGDTSSPTNSGGDIPDWLSSLGFNGAGGQAATPAVTTFSNPGSSSINPFGAALSGLNLFSSVGAGSGIGAAGAVTGLAGSLGAPKSLTSPLSTGTSLAGLGMNLASGNYLGAFGNAIGLGGKAGIPSYITQPLGLLTSALSGNPIGMGVNSLGILKGLINLFQGNSYSGQSNTPMSVQQATDQSNASLAQVPNYNLNPTFTPDQLQNLGNSIAGGYQSSTYLQNNAQNYSGQPVNMMNQGEAETPVASMSDLSMNALAQQTEQALSQSTDLQQWMAANGINQKALG